MTGSGTLSIRTDLPRHHNYTAIIDDPTRSDAWKLQRAAQVYTSTISVLATRLMAAANLASAQDAADHAHSDTYKITLYARAYCKVMMDLATELTPTANIASTQYKADAAAVFGTAGLPGDPATLVISRRDAGERVADENDSIKLQRLLDQAVLTGDDVLSHAIAEKAPGGPALVGRYCPLASGCWRCHKAFPRTLRSLGIDLHGFVVTFQPSPSKKRSSHALAIKSGRSG